MGPADGRARFTFLIPGRSLQVIEPEGIARSSYRLRLEGPEPIAEFVYDARDWVPKGDLSLYFNASTIPARDLGGRRDLCPLAPEIRGVIFGHDVDGDELDPKPDPAPVVASLSRLPGDVLRRCRNYPFAGYGRPFRDRELWQAFYGDKRESTGPLSAFEPNAAFDDKLLTSDDWRWVKLVDEAIAQQEAAAPPKSDSAASAASAPPRQPTSSSPSQTATASAASAPPTPHSSNCAVSGMRDGHDHGSLALWLALLASVWLWRRSPARR